MKITKKLVFNITLTIWILFSIGYIVYDLWTDFKTTQLNQAYQLGRKDTIDELILRAQQCEPFPVFSGEKQLNLINVGCLKAPETE